MNKEEKIAVLKALWRYKDCGYSEYEIRESLEFAIKALEQEPCEDVMAIHTQGLDEGIRCAMCTNSMKSNRGCDGGCVVNEGMYREVMNTIEKHIVPSVTPTTKWTPVSESFPKEHIYDDGYVEPSETVLVQLNNGEMKTSRYWGSRESRKDEPWIDLSYPTTLEVVAWRPLPQPYKESEE